MTINERELALAYQNLITAYFAIEQAGNLTNWKEKSIREAYETIQKAKSEIGQKIDTLTDWSTTIPTSP